MSENTELLKTLQDGFGPQVIQTFESRDGVPTFWVPKEIVTRVLTHLKRGVAQPYRMLYDLTAIDERLRANRPGMPPSDFTVVYNLLSMERNANVRLKVALEGEHPTIPTASGVWPNANWYERELWDMFGIHVEDHPDLRRILMPRWWHGHPLRKEHYARATEAGPFQMPEERKDAEQDALEFKPEQWGLKTRAEAEEYMFLNLGPQHPGTHGVLRLILQLAEERLIDVVPDIGFHHRAKEKMGERQSWHTFIPYTDRVDYLVGVINNLAYLASVEALAGIEIPERAKVIRVMLCEFYRISNHLVWYLGTFAQDMSARCRRSSTPSTTASGSWRSPRRSAAGGCTRTGSASAGRPRTCRAAGTKMVRSFLDYMPPRLREYDTLVLQNSIFRGRTQRGGRLHAGGGDRMGRDRPQPARLRQRLGPAQEAALQRLRMV